MTYLGWMGEDATGAARVLADDSGKPRDV